MAGSVNKVILIGNLGKDPEVRTGQDGSKIVNFTLATSETWNDRASGERKERTEWHRVVVFNDGPRKGLELNAVTTVTETPSVQAIFQLHRGVREGAWNTAPERIANADEACAGEGINMTVAADGSHYEIAVPSTGFRRSFVTLSPK